MNTLDSGYFEERLTDGARFVLPARSIGAARRWGWAVCGVAAFGLLFMVTWMAVPFAAGMAFLGHLPLIALAAFAFAGLGLAGLLPMLKLLALGCAILRNATSTEILLRNGSLICLERFCGLSYRRRCKMPIDKWQEFCIEPARLGTSQEPTPQLGLGNVESPLGASSQMLVVRWGAGREKRFVIAGAYPHETLQKLMEVLQSHLRHVTITEPPEPACDSGLLFHNHATSRREGAALGICDEIEQPPGSDVIVERREDGVTLSVPPAGIMRGSKGLFLFSIFWNGLIGLFALLLILAALGVIDTPQRVPWVGLLFLLPFVAVGIGTLLAAINMGIRTTAVATSGGLLFVARTGLFGKKTQSWSPSELLRIVVANSGMAVNDQPIKELQIHGSIGKVGILCERPEMELRWIAAELNQALRVVS